MTCLLCDGKPHIRGLCRSHYTKHWKAGTLNEYALSPRPYGDRGGGMPPTPECSVEFCLKKAVGRKLCNRHYYRVLQEEKGFAVLEKSLWDTSIKVGSAHSRVRRQWGPAKQYPCVGCPAQAEEWAYDGTDPTHLYGREREDRDYWMYYSRFPEFYMPLCKVCHRRRDRQAAAAELHAYRLSRIAERDAEVAA